LGESDWESHCWEPYSASELLIDEAARQGTGLVAGVASYIESPSAKVLGKSLVESLVAESLVLKSLLRVLLLEESLLRD
jgi:hypothetical protein